MVAPVSVGRVFGIDSVTVQTDQNQTFTSYSVNAAAIKLFTIYYRYIVLFVYSYFLLQHLVRERVFF